MAYKVRYERDDGGWWLVEVPAVKGCRTQARSLAEARRRIREALSLFVEDSDSAELVDDIRLPTEGQRAIEQMVAARAAAERASRAAAQSASDTVKVLTRKLGISVRDAAGVLGLSHQRVHQLVAPGPMSMPARANRIARRK